MSGATAWKPAAASAPIWWRQEYQDSGKPWQSSTSGPLPCSAMLRRMPLLSIIRWVGSLMFFPRSKAFAKRRLRTPWNEIRSTRAAQQRQYYRGPRTAPIHGGFHLLAGSGGFRHQFALAFAEERLERLGSGATEFFDRIGHREAGPLRIEACGAERLPERGEMLERVRIVAARKRVAAPLVVRDLFVAHVLGQDAPEGRDNLLQRDDGADHRIGGARRQRGAGQQADGNARHVLGRNEREHRVLFAPR